MILKLRKTDINCKHIEWQTKTILKVLNYHNYVHICTLKRAYNNLNKKNDNISRNKLQTY